MDTVAGLGVFASLLFLLVLVALAIAAIVMPLYVIAIHGHVKRLRQVEDARFMMYLRHGDASHEEIEEAYNERVISKRNVENIIQYRARHNKE